MLRKLACLTVLIISSSAGAYTSDYQLNFGPYVGGGDISNGSRVRHTSGYTLAVERHWPVNESGLSIGPRIEVTNGFVNSKSNEDGIKSIATYDNRFLAAGFRISQSVGTNYTFTQGVYLTGVVGKGYSKLSIDDTSDTTFMQRTYGNISGNFFGSELGGWIPLKGNFGLNLAVLANSYSASQSKVTGTYEGEIPQGQGLTLVKGTYENKDSELESNVTMKTFAGRIGVSLGF